MDVYAADFTGLVQSFKLRRINPHVLLPLPIVLSMCLSHVRLLEMVTPRYLLASTVSNVCPYSLYVVGNGGLFLGVIRMTWYFLALKLIC